VAAAVVVVVAAGGDIALVLVLPLLGAAATAGVEERPRGMLAAICEVVFPAMLRIAAASTTLQGSLPARLAMISSPETRATRPP
jgi:hypothetical protein